MPALNRRHALMGLGSVGLLAAAQPAFALRKPKPRAVAWTTPTATASPTPTPSPSATGTKGAAILTAAVSHLGEGPERFMTADQIAADTAWCSEFGSYVVTEAGAADLFTLGTPGTAVNRSTGQWYTWASDHTRLVWGDPALKADPTAANTLLTSGLTPLPGDVVLLWHWSSTRLVWSAHTAIVEATSVDTTGRLVLDTVDGNWGGYVKRRTVDSDTKGKIFAVIRP